MPKKERPQGIAAQVNRPFGDYIEMLAGGRSNRDLWALTGVSHSRIGDMRSGFVPGYNLLAQFLDGLQPPVTAEQKVEAFRRAGYVLPELEQPEHALDTLITVDPEDLDPNDPEIQDMVELIREGQQRGADGARQLSDHDLLIAAAVMLKIRRRKREKLGLD